jgi:hypothetical protein
MTVTGSLSGAGTGKGGVPRLPTKPQGWPVGSYEDYLQARRAVDYLAAHEFPVQEVTIVGVDLMLVERVIGRLSWGRVLGTGAASGLWFGFFVGLLLGLFDNQSSPIIPILVGMLAGTAFGLVFAAAGYASSRGRGRRDFQSASQLVAGRYDVLCLPKHAEKARDLIAKHSMSGSQQSL